jgi:hypothetical protein
MLRGENLDFSTAMRVAEHEQAPVPESEYYLLGDPPGRFDILHPLPFDPPGQPEQADQQGAQERHKSSR